MKTKIIIAGFVAFAMFFGTTFFVSATEVSETEMTSAQTSSSVSNTSNMTITQLQELVAKLQAMLAEKKTSDGKNTMLGTSSFAPTVARRIEIKGELKKGGEGEEIKILQRILASDKTIYPEGKATGFFGDLTSKALSRFQTKFGLEVTGTMNEETRDLINKILESENATGDVPSMFLMKPGLRDRIKIEWKNNNGKLERMIRVECDKSGTGNMCKNDDSKDGLKIKVEIKSSISKVEVENAGKSQKFLFSVTSKEMIIAKLSEKLGLSKDAIRAVTKFESDENLSTDNSSDDSQGDNEDDNDDGEDDNGGGN